MSQTANLYEKTEKIYPREVNGKFQTLRTITVYALLGLYYLLPFIEWSGRQAVLFDLQSRKFHIFNLTFWPQDFFFLSVLLIMAGILLFFVTSLAGRVWCGYACPQTVWTEIFIWMERWVEGSRAQQIKLTQQSWTLKKIYKRCLKQFLWISFSLFTGLIFVAYFVPVKELIPNFFTLNTSGWTLFWVLFYGFATYGNAGFLREQVCKYMCPYARFQSAMFDKDTLIVAYDEARGEPRYRGKRRKDSSATVTTGDCVDCGLCVQVCPTGIDIREGLQYECIACAACIDVCNDVMKKVNLPANLIRYSTEQQDQGDTKTLTQTLIRPRSMIYAAILAAIFMAWIYALSIRSNFHVDILRDRNSMFRLSENNQIENVYQAKLMNKSHIDQSYRIRVIGLDSAKAYWVNHKQNSNQNNISQIVTAGELENQTLIITVATNQLTSQIQNISIEFSETQGDSPDTITEKTKFWGPKQ